MRMDSQGAGRPAACGWRALAVWLVLIPGLTGCDRPPPEPDRETGVTGLRLAQALGGDDVEGFRRADRARAFEFPRDHGPHAGFRNEWWYVTGNLDGPDGERLGFHITFFRVGLAPELAGERHWQASAWASPDIWMAHTAVVDPGAGHHGSEERFARDGAGLAGASTPVGRVWVEDWRLAGLDTPRWELDFSVGDDRLELQLRPQRAPVLQGEAGLSRKGPEPGDASYYYSVPRIAVSGEVYRNGDGGRLPVTGQAWMDREWSTSALDHDHAGWDWFALQFADGLDLMYYQLRRTDGSIHPFSKGRWMPAGDRRGQLLEREHVQLVPTRHARLASGNRYPVEWAMEIRPPGDGKMREFTVHAVRDEQEMETVIPYWEGAVDIRDRDGNHAGRGFVELTGYDTR
ncbi:MAG: lipocalin-like domain-containing protein [Pseudomonadota bacterium]